MRAVIFDLDDTLIDSSHVRHLRDNQMWNDLSRHLSSIQPFAGVPEMLAEISRRGVKIGIVTNSPRRYCEQILSKLRLPYNALVAGNETPHGKPAKEPTEKCLRDLNVSPYEAVAIGDRCVDVESARGMNTQVGAMWGCLNPRDLKQSQPNFLISNPCDLFTVLEGGSSATCITAFYFWRSFLPKLWISSPGWDRREHLSSQGIPYSFARLYYGGKVPSWRRSVTNSLICNLKSKSDLQRRHKEEAARQFASDLNHVLPRECFVLFVMPSALVGTENYDDRWELVREYLVKHCNRIDLKFEQAIQVIEASTPAHHQSADSSDRMPKLIAKRLQWRGGIPNQNVEVAVIDDVLTKGGHLRAYHDLIKSMCPNVQVRLLAWAAYSDQAWHETQARFCH